jgi:hypothetical protein
MNAAFGLLRPVSIVVGSGPSDQDEGLVYVERRDERLKPTESATPRLPARE